MKPTVNRLRASLATHPRPPRYWIAYSGGLDSHVLLHLCSRLLAQEPDMPEFRALHVHHGLAAAADAWLDHCEQTCRALSLPFSWLRVDAQARPGESPEEAARRARYQAIRGHLGPGDIVLTAQHADDQAETLLLQLVRGAGVAGLAAMPPFAEFSPGFLQRPLLNDSRDDLQAYAHENDLHWIEDPSNADTSYDRNYIRHRVIPVLSRRWPAVSRSLARSAGHCADALRQLEDLSSDLYRGALNADGRSLSIERLETFKPADQRLVLRHWLRHSGFRMPAATTIERILRELLPAAADRMPNVAWSEGQVRRYRDGLFVLSPPSDFDTSATIPWDGLSRLELPQGNGELSVRTAKPGLSIDARLWHAGPIQVSYRQGGERCRLPGRAGSHSLKKLFQEAGIPPWLRECAPLVYIGEQLAAVADWWVTAPFAASGDAPALSLHWNRETS